ncbi:MAG TPA: ABC transporter permease, partial [Mycobacteriales bacterium]|nr:ABC transporter permease [Mycobacteriales bacterium]
EPVRAGGVPAAGGLAGAAGTGWRARAVSAARGAPPWTGVAVVLLLMVIGLIATQPLFVSYLNLNNVARGLAIPLLLAVGATLLLTTGMIDLSIGSMLALCTMVTAGCFNLGLPAWLAVLLTVLAGGALGCVNGLLIAKAGLSFFVVTLGTMAVYRSAAQLPTTGISVQLSDKPGFDLLAWLGDGEVGRVSVPVVVSVLALLAAFFVSRWTNFGRQVYAVGGNEHAARLAGISVDRVRIAVFALNGLLVGVAGVLFVGRIQAGSPLIGAGIELEVIAAVLLGGTSFLGGQSSLAGTTLGVLFIAVLQNGLNLVGVQALWRGVVTGAVLILAVWVDRLRRGGAQ